jgi:hypothetical protein
MPFSSASFRAKGDATTRPSFVELIGLVVACFSFVGVGVFGCSVLLVGSFSFFSVFPTGAVCSSEDFFFGVDDGPLPSSL